MKRNVGIAFALAGAFLVVGFQNCGEGMKSFSSASLDSTTNLSPAPLICASGEHEEAGVCMPNTKACTIADGIGQQTWGGTNYGTCQLVSCNANYTKLEEGCVAVYTPTAGTLRAYAAARGKLFGTAVQSGLLANAGEPMYSSIARSQFNLLTPENEMKWDTIRPARLVYDFTKADEIMRFAVRNGQKVRGHTLVWHSQNPAWLTNGNFSAAEKKMILEDHIAKTVGHFKTKYPGQVTVWDVVNESYDGISDVLRNSIWSNIGATPEDYIEIAFRAAAAADPAAILVYNDYYNEGASPRSNAIFNMISRMRAKGVPIHAVGFQVHMSTEYDPPPLAEIRANIQRYAAIGVAVHFTEADVRTNAADGVSTVEQNRVPAIYSNLINACLLEPSCTMFSIWGFTEKYSWIPSGFAGFTPSLLWNAAYQPNAIYTLFSQAMD